MHARCGSQVGAGFLPEAPRHIMYKKDALLGFRRDRLNAVNAPGKGSFITTLQLVASHEHLDGDANQLSQHAIGVPYNLRGTWRLRA